MKIFLIFSFMLIGFVTINHANPVPEPWVGAIATDGKVSGGALAGILSLNFFTT